MLIPRRHANLSRKLYICSGAVNSGLNELFSVDDFFCWDTYA